MDIFPFVSFLFSDKQPVDSFSLSFGGAYTFTAAPDAPPQRTFTLYLAGFKYYVNTDGSLDLTTNATVNNLGALVAFYNLERMYKTFTFPHPVWGNINCKFAQPLEVPKGFPGGDGMVEAFNLVLIEDPGS
jgi:hypothetical protein